MVMDPSERNRRAWDEIHRRRAAALQGVLGIPQRVRDRLPPLEGLRVLHLQCGTGESTIELAKAGALVTGVDISGEALAVAREREPDVPWVQADVQQLPGELRRARFDLVYVDLGSLPWLHDLDAWAAGVHAALRPLGWLVVYEIHPVAECLDAALHWRADYFDEGVQASVGWRHFDLEGEPAREEKHERFWRLGDVVTAVAHAGLVVKRLEEYPPRQDAYRRQDPRVPGEYLLRAEKPQ